MAKPVLLLLLASGSGWAAGTCEELAKLTLPQVSIGTAASVPAGEFTPPEAKQPLRNLPSFCRVAGLSRPSADSDIRFEVWLPWPATAWNGKFQGIGNGGFAGAISYGGLATAVSRGYATASTDTGHRGGGADAGWALNHPEKIVDFGHRAIHETAEVGKAVIRALYGDGPKRSYFNSCSNGGRQALMEAQRYPNDYDGIIAGAPANNWTRLLIGAGAGLKALLAEPGGYIPQAKLPAIQAAVQASCDKMDGVADGVLELPSRCKPDLTALACRNGEEAASCLTAPQMSALAKVYGGPRNRKGKTLFPGLSPGGEAEQGGWGPWITGDAREKSAMYAFGTQFFKNMVYSDPNWDYRAFDVDRDGAAAETKMGPILNATNPDLRPFHARGGKLILYHGWSDAAIPAQNAIDYYNTVLKKTGAAKAKQFARLFMVPGMQHCGGGSGANSFGQGGPSGETDPMRDINAALEQWVEKGVAPERLIAVRYRQGTRNVERTRPLCAWPQVARYKGSGSTDDAANFTCALP